MKACPYFNPSLVSLRGSAKFRSYSDFNFEIAQNGKIYGKINFFFQFFKNSNIYLPMCYLSFFQFFSDFPLKNRVKFDSFSLFFEFHHSIHSSVRIYKTKKMVFNIQFFLSHVWIYTFLKVVLGYTTTRVRIYTSRWFRIYTFLKVVFGYTFFNKMVLDIHFS